MLNLITTYNVILIYKYVDFKFYTAANAIFSHTRYMPLKCQNFHFFHFLISGFACIAYCHYNE